MQNGTRASSLGGCLMCSVQLRSLLSRKRAVICFPMPAKQDWCPPVLALRDDKGIMPSRVMSTGP
jgi:hypothetical protein